MGVHDDVSLCIEALARCEAETGLPAPAKAKPLRWSPLESRESALERARHG